mgnify:CR=1 FL=1
MHQSPQKLCGYLPASHQEHRLDGKALPQHKGKGSPQKEENLGYSIEERPEIVDFRAEFGHCEIYTVIGKKDENEPCVLTLMEHMTQMCIRVKAQNHTAEAINEALQKVMSYFVEQKNQVFKTNTGTTARSLQNSLIEDGKLKMCLTHP